VAPKLLNDENHNQILGNNMSGLVQIFAVGGGGFTHSQDGGGRDALLEDRLLALVGSVTKLKIGYIGHAKNDRADRLTAFYARFVGCARTTHLPITADAAMAQDFLQDLDILYVGGGTTTAMLSHWRKSGIADLLVAAIRRGLVASGVSAGAICWFSDLLLKTEDDCFEPQFEQHKGLGLIAGSACPHFSSEPDRKQAFEAAIASRQLQSGIAIDDGVGVHIINGVVAEIVRARSSGSAYLLAPDGDMNTHQALTDGHQLGMGSTNGDASV
jgi:peptidase E